MLRLLLDSLSGLLPRGWREEGGERRFELGLRVGLAVLGIEKPRTVDQAGVSGS
jgi:hypothetical protein